MKYGHEGVSTTGIAVEYDELYEDRKERLLALLPQELQERWEEASVEEIQDILAKRERAGYKKILGYHVSPVNFPVGGYVEPDQDGVVYYSDDIGNLYGRHGGGFIYIVEGTVNDEMTDKELGWRITKGKLRVIDKITINPRTMDDLGAEFAEVEYH